MNDARIAELLAPFLSDNFSRQGRESTKRGDEAGISPGQVRSISTYIDLLLRWNARVNLTAVRDPEEIVTRHFGESIFAARHLFPESAGAGPQRPDDTGMAQPRVIDVGSGAGFPGLPIKIWAPNVQLTLIESNQKKATFLREVARSLTVADVDVFTGRAEAYEGSRGDIVTLRAVERFETILPVAARLVSPAGRIAVLVGEAQIKAVGGLAPGLRWTVPVELPLSANRVLIIGSKEP